MKTIKIFQGRPDYMFGSEEVGKTVLVWPADKDFPDGDSPVHYRTLHESAGIVDFVVFGYPIPIVAEVDSLGELRRKIEAKAREVNIDPSYLIW